MHLAADLELLLLGHRHAGTRRQPQQRQRGNAEAAQAHAGEKSFFNCADSPSQAAARTRAMIGTGTITAGM